MHRRFYTVTRDLHLYLGLFISPFVLVFSVTVFFFVHAIAPKFGAETTQTRAATAVSLLPDLSKLSGRPLIDALKPTLSSINVSSIYLWLKQPRKLLPGALCLALGSLLCGLFCFGLRWM